VPFTPLVHFSLNMMLGIAEFLPLGILRMGMGGYKKITLNTTLV